jgi:poly-gamma-glutamate synthesis protein (capsule biosynthesis protein)
MAFTGDMLIHDPVFAQAKADAGGKGYDFEPMLAQVAPILRSADFAVCHQETPISDDDVGVSGYPDFNAPHELAADEAWAGWDACDTASNHTVDLGQGGIKATLDSLDAAGIQHTGSYRSEKESEQLTIYDVKGVKVGHLAYTYGLNGNNIPHSWSVNLIDVAKIKSDAHRLKQAGADIVIVSVHAGTEQVQAPSSYQKQVDAEIMQSPDVDLIVGAHAHVVQPLKRLDDGRWIIYGLGNFLAQQETNSDQAHPLNRDGVIIEVTFARSGSHYAISKVGFVATMVAVPSDVVQIAPSFSHERTAAILRSMGAPVTDVTP